MYKYLRNVIIISIVILFIPKHSIVSGEMEQSVKEALKELGYSSIGLRQNLMNEFEVKATINGKSEITLIINFGMPSTVFDKRKLDDLGIECFKTNQEYSLNDDVEDMYATTIDSLNIGDGKISAMDLMVVDYSDFDVLEYTRAGGILGRDFLIKFQAIIDYGNQILYLKTK